MICNEITGFIYGHDNGLDYRIEQSLELIKRDIFQSIFIRWVRSRKLRVIETGVFRSI